MPPVNEETDLQVLARPIPWKGGKHWCRHQQPAPLCLALCKPDPVTSLSARHTINDMLVSLIAGPTGTPKKPHNRRRHPSNNLDLSRSSSRFLVHMAARSVSRFSLESGMAFSKLARVSR